MVFESRSRSLKKKTAAVEKMVFGECLHQVDVYIYISPDMFLFHIYRQLTPLAREMKGNDELLPWLHSSV